MTRYNTEAKPIQLARLDAQVMKWAHTHWLPNACSHYKHKMQFAFTVYVWCALGTYEEVSLYLTFSRNDSVLRFLKCSKSVSRTCDGEKSASVVSLERADVYQLREVRNVWQTTPFHPFKARKDHQIFNRFYGLDFTRRSDFNTMLENGSKRKQEFHSWHSLVWSANHAVCLCLTLFSHVRCSTVFLDLNNSMIRSSLNYKKSDRKGQSIVASKQTAVTEDPGY